MTIPRLQHLSARSSMLTAACTALTLLLAAACAVIAGPSDAGEALQEADFEIHDLLMQDEDVVHADLERPDGATDVEHFELATAIIWDHLDDEIQQAEIRLRGPDETDEVVIYSAEELQEIHRDRGSDIAEG